MIHSFDTEHARLYGIEEAILIHNFQYWIAHKRANRMHFYDGRTWTYNSVQAFAELFPYMTYATVRRALESLVKHGVLLAGYPDKQGVDRTKWYAFADEKSFLPEAPHLSKNANGLSKNANASAQNSEPLYKIENTDISADAPKKFKPADYLKSLGVEQQVLQDWLSLRKQKRAEPTQTAIDRIVKEAAKAGLSLNDALIVACSRGWTGFEAAWVVPVPATSGKPANKFAGAK